MLICAQRQAVNYRIAWPSGPRHLAGMTDLSNDAWQFYREVAASGFVWALRDGDDIPIQKSATGQRSQAFWSSKTRVKQATLAAPGLKRLKLFQIPWDDFAVQWAPGLEANNIYTVLNWSGGGDAYYMRPLDVVDAVQSLAGA